MRPKSILLSSVLMPRASLGSVASRHASGSKANLQVGLGHAARQARTGLVVRLLPARSEARTFSDGWCALDWLWHIIPTHMMQSRTSLAEPVPGYGVAPSLPRGTGATGMHR